MDYSPSQVEARLELSPPWAHETNSDSEEPNGCSPFLLGLRRAVLVSLLTFALTPGVRAGEGASSNYFPGTYGDFAVAIAPEPGWIYLNYSLFYSAEADSAVLQGRANASLDTFAYVNMSAGLYAFDKPVLGGRFVVGAYLPVGYVDLETEVAGLTTSSSVDDSETALGDMALVPASIYWNRNNWHFNVYELVITPTGDYDVDNIVNLGRNYWSFDTVFALTNFNIDKGREYSLVAGFMINDRNDDTDYETGNEVHVDAMFNQFFSETFALGFHGYYHGQVEGDSGTGAILGDFKGRSYGIGPSALWIPGGGKFIVSASWLHDLDATNKLESDYAIVTFGWQLGGGGN